MFTGVGCGRGWLIDGGSSGGALGGLGRRRRSRHGKVQLGEGRCGGGGAQKKTERR